MYGERLKRIRLKAGLTQKDFADTLSVPQTTYSHYEQELSEPPFDFLRKVCSLYTVDMNYLLGQTKTSYQDVLKDQYDDFADLVSMGFSTDEAYRMEKDLFNRYGDMVMQLSYEDRKRVVDFVEQIKAEHDSEE